MDGPERSRKRGIALVRLLTAAVVVGGVLVAAGAVAAFADQRVGAVRDLVVDDQLLWWITRTTGLVLLPMFTAVLVLGILTSGGRRLGRSPRFVTLALHRSLSLASVGFAVVHVTAVVLNTTVDVGVVDVLVPFVSGYEAFWTGLGTTAVLLLVVLVTSSLARVRLGYRVWRTLHAASWLFFAVSLAHGTGIGTDTRTWWGLALSAACVVAILAAFAAGRSRPAWRAVTPRRTAALEGADR